MYKNSTYWLVSIPFYVSPLHSPSKPNKIHLVATFLSNLSSSPCCMMPLYPSVLFVAKRSAIRNIFFSRTCCDSFEWSGEISWANFPCIRYCCLVLNLPSFYEHTWPSLTYLLFLFLYVFINIFLFLFFFSFFFWFLAYLYLMYFHFSWRIIFFCFVFLNPVFSHFQSKFPFPHNNHT